MEENNNSSRSKRKITVIDLTSDDENLKPSTSSCNPQVKRKKININEAPRLIRDENIKYKYRQNMLDNIVQKVQINKINTKKREAIPAKLLDNEKIPILYSKRDAIKKKEIPTTAATNLKLSDSRILRSKCNRVIPVTEIITVDVENDTSLYSECDKKTGKTIPAIPPTNLDTKDITILDSESNTNTKNITSALPSKNLNANNITDIISQNASQSLKEFCQSYVKLNKDMEKISSNTKKNTEILIQDYVPYTKLNVNNIEMEVTVFSNDIDSDLLINQISNEENVCRFYWWDAYEDLSEENVYLFGKVYDRSIKTSYSSCLTIKDLSRKIYLLPTKCNSLDGYSKETTKEDVYNEFNELANSLGIKEFKSRWVTKKYVFPKETLDSKEYLEIVYPAKYLVINSKYTGSAIEKIFQTDVSPLTLLLLEKNIKGPCWLDVKDPINNLSNPSWCKVNIICRNMNNISVSVLSQSELLPLPPIVLATINVCASLRNITRPNEILMVVVLLKDEYLYLEDATVANKNQPFKQTFCLINKPNNTSWPPEVDQVFSNITNTNVIKCENEIALLNQLLHILEQADPDLYIGYDCNFQFELLLDRIFSLNVTNWHKIGKIKKSSYPIHNNQLFIEQAVSGRPICDIKVISLELNVKSHNLKSLSKQVLKKESNQSDEMQRDNYMLYYTSEKDLEDFIKFIIMETRNIFSIALELNVVSFVIELTCISGYYLSKLLQTSQMKINEFFLSRAFYTKNYILPDSMEKNQGSEIKKPTYEGGLVLTPLTGFYDKLVLLMDYISLYPSIIIEYNLCFSTIPGAAYTNYQDLKIPESNSEPGIIPKEMHRLIEYRKELKELMKLPCISPNRKIQYNTKQLALKFMANSIYGCLGAPSCKFYGKGLAALITSKGRKILTTTKQLIENMKHEIIYGDTDSIMIKTNLLEYDEVISIGNKIKEETNKSFRYIKLDIDSVFRYFLLLQKKKYAALEMNKLPNGQTELSQIYKGLLISRRDWCPLSVQIGKDILNHVLSDASNSTKMKSICEILQNILIMIKKNSIPLSSFVISKQLSKNLRDYFDNNQPHVQVARRLSRRTGKILKAGDIISYIMCKSHIISQKSYHMSEFKQNESLKIDVNYYLKKQLLPVALTICEPIKEIEKIWIIKSLGLNKINETTDFLLKNVKGTQGKFNRCRALTFRCLNCKTKITITDIIFKSSDGCKLFLQTICSNDECETPLWKSAKIISDELQLNINQAINMYNLNMLKCDNTECSYETKCPSLDFSTKSKCYKCKKSLSIKYTKSNLQDDIRFYCDIFDLRKLENESLLNNCSKEVISTYNTLRDSVNKYIQTFYYSTMSLDKIFRYKFMKHSNDYLNYNILTNEYLFNEEFE